MIIETERLIIADLTIDMCVAVQENSIDEDNKRFVPDEVFETIEDARKTVEWLIESSQCEKGPFLYPILLKNKTNIGYVQVCSLENDWEIGYHIAKKHTGNGYATEAIREFLPIIMKTLCIDSIYGVVVEENIASHKVLEKCNFKMEFKGTEKYQGADIELRRYIFNI